MEEIIQLNSVSDYNQLRGAETLHPLVTVLDLSTLKTHPPHTIYFGLYAVFLKELNCGELRYGRTHYDYQDGTLVFIGPGQTIAVEKKAKPLPARGWALLFHPDLIRGTSLGKRMHEFSFFSYDVTEALHLSEKERLLVMDCFAKIRYELEHAIDKHSRTLIASNIELFLNYCIRFYDRQFITRDTPHRGVLARLETVLHEFFFSGKTPEGLPSVGWCAGQLHLSPNYFGDLVRKETRVSAQEYIQSRVMDIAKEKILDPGKSISEVAYELGYKYPQHFTRVFKQHVGKTPLAYRAELN